MGKSFLADTLLINQNVVVDQRMRVEGMIDGGMVLLLGVKIQDKRQPPQIHPLHEVGNSILCCTLDVTDLLFRDL